MEAARYERCATVSQALTLLRLEWATVLGEIEAAFNFGVLAGTEIEQLSNALNVVITVEEPQVQTNAGTTPRWRPRFRYCDGGIQQVLGIPADRLAAHRNVMLVSYLLRASADYALKWVMPDPVHRNSVVRDEVDFLMFGTFPKFARRLADFGSLEAVHSADIPLQLVGGYLTKHIPSASLESFLAATPYYGYESGAVLPSVGKAVRRIGSGPSFRSHLEAWRHSGEFLFHHPTVQHVVRTFKHDIERVVVAVSRPLSDIVHAASGDALVAINKVVVYSCGRRDLDRTLSHPELAFR